jgi:phosphoribosyl 1,2-cyclic phosphate phosphodiesterase
MRLTFLGTAAATSCPLMFCRCEVCEKARKLGGPDFRKRSSLLINKDLLIDLGPDIMSASFMHGIAIADVRYCLQTHSHSDHFDASHFSTRVPEYATVNVSQLELYASNATLSKMSEMLRNEGCINDIFDPNEQKRLNINVFTVKALQTFEAGKYKISAFPANHDKSVEPLLYTITESCFTVFYGVDTDILPAETWQGFHDKKLQFDIVVLDHTYGPNIDGEGHLNASQFIMHIHKMRDENLLKKNARIFATHISHEGNPIHSEMVKYGKKHGYEIAYDGLVVEI